VAVDPAYIDPEDLAVTAVVRAHRRALQVIHDDPASTVRHIQAFLGWHTAPEARAHYEKFIAPYFTVGGQADLAVGEAAIVAAELGVPATVTAADFYRTATTAP
jgi:NitT/TauT family transport system substrate-binding protein